MLEDRGLSDRSIWLLDVARDIDPAAKLDGFDVSLDQCPPSQWLPSNLNLHTWNIFEEPPAEYKGVFDVVHIRLITVAIKNNDPRPVLVNLRKLLSMIIFLSVPRSIKGANLFSRTRGLPSVGRG